MTNKIVEDPRIDPRIKAIFAGVPQSSGQKVARREDLLAGIAAMAANPQANSFASVLETQDFEAIAPSAGLDITSRSIPSSPDGNMISMQIIRPRSGQALPCVYYIHGGGMVMMSAYDPHFTAWGRMIAANGVAVVLVEFRNALAANTLPEVAPYPAGLNDCLSGLRWMLDNAADLGIDPDRVVVAGESGGGNLTMATALAMKRDGEIAPDQGALRSLPLHQGRLERGGWRFRRSQFGHSHRPARRQWSLFRMVSMRSRHAIRSRGRALRPKMILKGLPKVKISVNECDPLMDEGIALYRKLMRAGVSAQCQVAMGTIHGTETFLCCPDISHSAARDIAAFARD